jgi:3-hydroxybutyryl-CoA dehydrogenase
MAPANLPAMTSVQTIGVIGAGTMGTGIAQVCALAGLAVAMVDIDDERVERGRGAVASGLDRLLRKAKISAAARDAAVALAKRLGKTPVVAAGHIGRKSGRGFYTYS